MCYNSAKTNLVLNKSDLNSIKCISKKELKVNATEKSKRNHTENTYEFEGVGKDVCIINSESINLILK